MDIKRVPPSILVALGLAACGPRVDTEDDAAESSASQSGSVTETTTGACLSTVGPCLGAPNTSSGPCLGAPQTTTGPCLEVQTTTCLASTSGFTDSGTDSSGTGSDTGGTTFSPCLAPKGDREPPPGEHNPTASAAPVRSNVLERVLERGVLPADVAKKLKT